MGRPEIFPDLDSSVSKSKSPFPNRFVRFAIFLRALNRLPNQLYFRAWRRLTR